MRVEGRPGEMAEGVGGGEHPASAFAVSVLIGASAFRKDDRAS
jgi:hypothetical protein